jgi:hypothetical protein
LALGFLLRTLGAGDNARPASFVFFKPVTEFGTC